MHSHAFLMPHATSLLHPSPLPLSQMAPGTEESLHLDSILFDSIEDLESGIISPGSSSFGDSGSSRYVMMMSDADGGSDTSASAAAVSASSIASSAWNSIGTVAHNFQRVVSMKRGKGGRDVMGGSASGNGGIIDFRSASRSSQGSDADSSSLLFFTPKTKER